MSKYKTIVVSDIHLGMEDSKVNEIIKFLTDNKCDTLILNGDIIDAWNLKRRGKWKKKYTNFFSTILKLVSHNKTKVIYIRGNHDDFLDEVAPFNMGLFEIKKELILDSGNKKFLVIHGDVFDDITSKVIWLSKLGDIGYNLLLSYNRWYNKRRMKRGKPYHSISQDIKNKVKNLVKIISKFENKAIKFAHYKKCNGIICGHTHKADIYNMGDIIYMNSGDWVETLSALVEDYDGKWTIKYFHESEKKKKK
jgi:UDP-2,3-diacylglucosamine pyrophosphatase LpxH